jgi:hypothetical protein
MSSCFSNRSVREHRQSARVVCDRVLVTSFVGRAPVRTYSLALSEWAELERQHPNPAWWKHETMRKLTAQMDDEPGGPDQAERIRDAQVWAIDAAFAAHREASQ